MRNKRQRNSLIAYLLCLAIIVSTSGFNQINVHAENVVAEGVAKDNSFSFGADSESDIAQLLYVMPFAAEYIEELNCIRAIWDVDDVLYSKFYVRYDDSMHFDLLATINDLSMDVEPNSFVNHCDMRVIAVLPDGTEV